MLPPDFEKGKFYSNAFDTFYRNKCMRDTYDNEKDNENTFARHNAFFFSPWKF